jgi:fused signal recognition particle receptor
MVDGSRMAEASSDKPTLFSRLFGRKADEPPAKPAEEKSGTSASWTEGRPDFANAAAAGEITPVAPTETAASPDLPPERTVPAELAGADLQPVEGTAPENRDAEPTGTSAPAEPATTGWWRRLTDGMRRTSSSLSESVTSLFTKRKLDAATLEELEDALIQADLGVATAARIVKAVSQGRYDKEVAPGEVKAILATEVEKVLEPVAKSLAIDRAKKPFVVLMIGVNGSGKTTTIGKLAAKFRAQGLSVMLAAGDTFRAAAIEQLKVWGERTGAPVLAREQGADAAGLAFDALQAARENGIDVLLVDTAGRLQNKAGLMAELEKIVRVMKKLDESAPHAVLLVLDATVGQNALSQVELFRQTAGVTGLVMTKLDGTARGGILVALAAKFGVPVHFIGVGEGVEDLEPFAARDFARAIAGLEQAA